MRVLYFVILQEERKLISWESIYYFVCITSYELKINDNSSINTLYARAIIDDCTGKDLQEIVLITYNSIQ